MFLHAARQPILDKNLDLYAYELLFRESSENLFPQVNGDAATSQLIAVSQFEYSLPELTGGKHAHINFNYQSIINGYPSMVPCEQMSVEIIGVDKPGKRLLEECKKLKLAGYKIILDDYVHQKAWIHFFPYIEMIKLDMLTSSVQELRQAIKIKEKFSHIKVAIKKIETDDDFQIAKGVGFDLFQGYFFAKPQYFKEKTIATSNHSLAELMFDVSNSQCDIDKIVDTFQSDTSLSYKLLRYSNSAIFMRQAETSTIKQAVVALGAAEIQKFVTILFTAQSIGNKPLELISMSLLRARICEGISNLTNTTTTPAMAFLSGMLSLIDVMLEEPMADILAKLKLSKELNTALLDHQGDASDYIDIAKCYENADWAGLGIISSDLSIDQHSMSDVYRESVSWVNEKMKYIAL